VIGCLRWLPFGSYLEMQGILEMPCKTVQSVKKWKAFWKCHPLTDSRTKRDDEATNLSLQNKKQKLMENKINKTRYFLELAYDGATFVGWQVQPNKTTVQSTIDHALSTIFNEPIQSVGCGRTDSGVHASKFFLHFEATKPMPNKIVFRLNSFLPKTIAIYRIFQSGKHARYDATYRAYDYFIHFDKNPFLETHSFFFRWLPLDFEKMRQAAMFLPNYLEFAPFEKSKSDSKTSICHIYKSQLTIDEQAGRMHYHIAANRFLRGMVRRVVGALLMVGKEKISLQEFQEVLQTQGSFNINKSAPAQGLYLCEVRYDDFCWVNWHGL